MTSMMMHASLYPAENPIENMPVVKTSIFARAKNFFVKKTAKQKSQENLPVTSIASSAESSVILPPEPFASLDQDNSVEIDEMRKQYKWYSFKAIPNFVGAHTSAVRKTEPKIIGFWRHYGNGIESFFINDLPLPQDAFHMEQLVQSIFFKVTSKGTLIIVEIKSFEAPLPNCFLGFLSLHMNLLSKDLHCVPSNLFKKGEIEPLPFDDFIYYRQPYLCCPPKIKDIRYAKYSGETDNINFNFLKLLRKERCLPDEIFFVLCQSLEIDIPTCKILPSHEEYVNQTINASNPLKGLFAKAIANIKRKGIFKKDPKTTPV
jgi:hypothetical protein